MRKEEIYEITIEDIADAGQGVGHIDGMAVFVKDALPGDRIRAKIIKLKKNYAYGRLEEIIEPSSYRVEPKCENARRCGGCTLMHMDYEAQLKYKRDKVINALVRIGKQDKDFIESIMEPAHGMTEGDGNSERGTSKEPYRFRNKMQFPIGRDKDGKTVIGFYAGRTHFIIPSDDCIIGHEVNRYIIAAMYKYIEECHVSIYDEKKLKGLLRHVISRVGFATGELMICVVVNGKELPEKYRFIEIMQEAVDEYNDAQAELNEMNSNAGREMNADTDLHRQNGTNIDLASVVVSINDENTNRILGRKSKILYGRNYIEDYITTRDSSGTERIVKFHISAESFYQVNPAMTRELYSKAIEYAGLNGTETVWDMYCGIGTISLSVASKAKEVYGVEIVPEAIEDARSNAALNEIENATSFVGKAEEVVPEIYENGDDASRAEVVIVDPPRKGCDEKLLETICSMAPDRLVYVSCDPATLARDVAYLRERGFQMKKAAVYDQFCHSGHVETAALLKRD